MRRTRWFLGKGESLMERTWSAADQATTWIHEEEKRGGVTYREIDVWAPGIVVAMVSYRSYR
jgi:hypothetical protein